ncbi:AGC/PKG protein kinase, variant [Aphanomyces invadans]|uniref:cGMP-dependent protein kinase n=1 Tax=Aphanomyces invadans TaxID=157072 RepID=A0A024U2F9_9STRA|nr:AGC/PKG protein kinase, variant [Aphanomyces invadans]ETW00626.1 AGC/PKG protein kinase, variant [Aphanomyces invadans]|eukprot:XP_008870761.1 AGC/PKG protein kinase, variant [Aphanomyces invadans]
MGSGVSSPREPESLSSLTLFHCLKDEYADLVSQAVADEVVFETLKQMYVQAVHDLDTPLPIGKRGSWARRNSDKAKKAKRTNVFTPGLDLQTARVEDQKQPTKTPEVMKLLRDNIQALLFEATTDDEMDKVVAVMTDMTVPAGDVVIHQNDHGDKFYVLEHGSCEFLVNNIHVGDVEAGGHFGELALIYDAPRAATVRATRDCTLWTLGRNEFRTIQAQSSEDSLAKRSHWLRNVPIFSSLSARQLSLLNRAFEVVKFEPDEIIVKQGVMGDAFYIVSSGSVVCTMDGSKRNLHVKSTSANEVARLGEGEYFGETSLLNDQPRNCTVRAIGPVKCLRLHRSDFDSMLGPLYAILEMNAFKRILRMFDIFKTLSDDEIEHLTTHFEIVELGSDKTIFTTGDNADFFYIVRTGSVLFLPDGSTSASIDPVTLNVKDYFGAEMFQGTTYQSTVRTGVDSATCFRLSKTFVNEDLASGRNCCFLRQTKSKTALNPLSLLELSELVHIGVLGEGSFGRVSMVQAFVNAEEHLLALKCVSKSHVVECHQQEHIMRERAILHDLKCHPFIVQLHATYQDQNYLYMLMELVQGGELFGLLHANILDRPLVEDDIKFFAANVYLALEHMHKRDIAYRDLKPENLLISANGYLKVVDMGFAKKIPFTAKDDNGHVAVHARSYTLCGTQEYLAPEFVLNTGHDLAVDYWAFGILIYEMFLGYTPFETPDGDIAKLFKNIAFVRTGANCVQFPHDCTADFPVACSFIESLLHGDPTKRLGMGQNGSHEIRNHPWFHDLDWDKLRDQQLPVPYVPQLNGRYDTSLFEGDQGLRSTDIDYDGAENYLFEGF